MRNSGNSLINSLIQLLKNLSTLNSEQSEILSHLVKTRKAFNMLKVVKKQNKKKIESKQDTVNNKTLEEKEPKEQVYKF